MYQQPTGAAFDGPNVSTSEQWVQALGGIAPTVPEDRRRAATHAAIGLINSTPYLETARDRATISSLLETMAAAALYRALDVPIPLAAADDADRRTLVGSLAEHG